MWTGWDYLGESGLGTVRYKSFKNPGEDSPIISGGCGVIVPYNLLSALH